MWLKDARAPTIFIEQDVVALDDALTHRFIVLLGNVFNFCVVKRGEPSNTLGTDARNSCRIPSHPSRWAAACLQNLQLVSEGPLRPSGWKLVTNKKITEGGVEAGSEYCLPELVE